MKKLYPIAFVLATVGLVSCTTKSDADTPVLANKTPADAGVVATDGSDCVVDPQETGTSIEDRQVGARVAKLYLEYAGDCPTQAHVDELRYIWKENEDNWTEFPGQAELFFTSNVKYGLDAETRELIGRSFDEARTSLTSDPDFPLSQDRGPTVVGDMTLYEFSGGMSVYLLVVRDGRIESIYFFDQI